MLYFGDRCGFPRMLNRIKILTELQFPSSFSLLRSLAIQVSGRSPPGGPETQDRGPDGLPFLGDGWSGATVVRRVLSGPGSARAEPREVRPPTLGWGQS